MKRKQKTLCLLSMILLLCSGCGKTEMAPEQSVICVTAGEMQGSGVIYERQEEYFVLVTAAHVLEQEAEEIVITFYDGYSVEGASYHISTDSDVAFINVPLASLPKTNRKEYQPVSIDKEVFDTIQEGTEVAFYGGGYTDRLSQENGLSEVEEPTGGQVLNNWIYVEDFAQYMMLLQGQICPGMSGGGVFDTAGNFLGILCGANEEEQVVALPLSIIQAEYAQVY
ncbi:MAG: trypsin-like peptidase domain-containing protein [Lachnospiraceae bacterium]|nr:trypsin-like peptidase domain-containing protein [Lachnospiraceae bacterium]